MSHVLVTGGAGFIGSHLCERLLAAGHDVTALDDLSTGRREHVPDGVRLVVADVADAEAVRAGFEGETVDAVFHVAGQASIARSFDRPERDLRTNVLGTLNVLEACLAAGVPRLVHASSMTAYGEPSRVPTPEDEPCVPVSNYGVTKYAAERYVHVAAERGLAVTSLRMFNVYGERQSLTNPYQGVLAIFVGNVLRGEPITIHSDGAQTRDFVYVADVADAWLRVLDDAGDRRRGAERRQRARDLGGAARPGRARCLRTRLEGVGDPAHAGPARRSAPLRRRHRLDRRSDRLAAVHPARGGHAAHDRVGAGDCRASPHVKRLLPALARTRLGSRTLASLVTADPQPAIEALGPRLRLGADFGAVEPPVEIRGFEDVAFLFASGQLNRGIASLDLDEAAYIWRLARGLAPGTLVEIGRYKGGSTFLIAAAMDAGSRLVSYDLHVKGGSGDERDRQLVQALERVGLDDQVELVVGDSRTAPAPGEPCTLVFVDGDHSYEGARADYARWRPRVAPGGHLLFHDAVATRELTTCDPNVARLVAEIERDDPGLERAGAAGSLVHFRVRTTP